MEILDICCERPMNVNSTLDGLRDRRLAVIQDEMSECYIEVDLLR